MCAHIHANIYFIRHDTCTLLKRISDVSTGWRRPIGCLKLQVIFRKRATMYRALSRKMTFRVKASYDSTPPCTGWRRPIGCPRLQVIFHKRATNYRALLQKMTYKHKASHRSSPLCGSNDLFRWPDFLKENSKI